MRISEQQIVVMTALKTSINCNKVGNCSLTLVLDKRNKGKVGSDEFPIAICFTIERKRFYHLLHEIPHQSEKYFNSVCSVVTARSQLMPVFKEWQAILENYREKMVKLSKTQTLTLELIRTYLTGKQLNPEYSASFVGVWEGLIARMREENRVGTAENYQWALNSFNRIIGKVNGFKVDKNVIAKWDKGMKQGCIVKGEEIKPIADATRGMYLRTCRVVFNECIREGYIPAEMYPFSNKDKTLVSIPRGKKRQQSYLSVEEMTLLYNVFIEKRYPDTWSPSYKERAHDSLGLFLAQYLCNGFNLADAGRLTYNRTYFQEGGKAFEFMRKKTSARSNDMSVVIVPIIDPLQTIIDEIGAKPQKDGYVFPQIFNGETDEMVRRKLTVQENSNIKDRVTRISKEMLGWDKLISGTWARHSFATNLKLAGVEELYISESMGHSQGNDVTSGYQDMYPLEIRFRNNSKLLNLATSASEQDVDTSKITSLEEALEVIKRLQGK